MIGPGKIAKRVEPLRNLGNAVLTSEGNIGPVKELGKLGRELQVAAGGVAQLRDGISEASDGAGLLALGADRAGAGGADDGGRAGAGLERQRAGDLGAGTVRQGRPAGWRKRS